MFRSTFIIIGSLLLLSSLTFMPANAAPSKADVANLQQYSVRQISDTEIHVSARYNGGIIEADLVVDHPSVILFNPTDLNIRAVSINGIDPNEQLVSVYRP